MNKFKRFIIHKLGGFTLDEIPYTPSVKFTKIAYPTIPLKIAVQYESGVPDTIEYVKNELGHKLGSYIINSDFAIIEEQQIDDWMNECSARIDIVDRRTKI